MIWSAIARIGSWPYRVLDPPTPAPCAARITYYGTDGHAVGCQHHAGEVGVTAATLVRSPAEYHGRALAC